jgi:hypothetical protein
MPLIPLRRSGKVPVFGVSDSCDLFKSVKI